MFMDQGGKWPSKNLLPWKSLCRILAEQGMVLLNYPADVPLPGETDGSSKTANKGIAALTLAEQGILRAALQATGDGRVQFMKSSDKRTLQDLQDSKKPVITTVRPTPGSKVARRYMFADGTISSSDVPKSSKGKSKKVESVNNTADEMDVDNQVDDAPSRQTRGASSTKPSGKRVEVVLPVAPKLKTRRKKVPTTRDTKLPPPSPEVIQLLSDESLQDDAESDSEYEDAAVGHRKRKSKSSEKNSRPTKKSTRAHSVNSSVSASSVHASPLKRNTSRVPSLPVNEDVPGSPSPKRQRQAPSPSTAAVARRNVPSKPDQAARPAPRPAYKTSGKTAPIAGGSVHGLGSMSPLTSLPDTSPSDSRADGALPPAPSTGKGTGGYDFTSNGQDGVRRDGAPALRPPLRIPGHSPAGTDGSDPRPRDKSYDYAVKEESGWGHPSPAMQQQPSRPLNTPNAAFGQLPPERAHPAQQPLGGPAQFDAREVRNTTGFSEPQYPRSYVGPPAPSTYYDRPPSSRSPHHPGYNDQQWAPRPQYSAYGDRDHRSPHAGYVSMDARPHAGYANAGGPSQGYQDQYPGYMHSYTDTRMMPNQHRYESSMHHGPSMQQSFLPDNMLPRAPPRHLDREMLLPGAAGDDAPSSVHEERPA
ncbi:hypothetical protein PLICRDRAFT_552320 [Plicaturopsis crispa FD-325 SS-3]|nr:hypothetical protein PLICRDRAFT_552320 [Plicaturopsis crispa FD-325 SS-3]